MHYATGLGSPSTVLHDEETIPVFARWFGSWRVSLQRRALNSDQLTHAYDLAAPLWSQRLDRLGVPDAYEALLRRVLSEEAPGLAGAQLRVLDCGVGTGALSGALARVLPTPFKLDAIDISPRMLERASRRLCETDLEVSLRCGDVRKLPYGTGVFDLVMTGHVLEHLVDPSVALGEMVRVLKPGGLLITCLTRRSPLGMYVHLKWRTHQVTPVQAERYLIESGLERAHCLSFDRHPLCRQLSLACVGRKPLREGHAGLRAATSVKLGGMIMKQPTKFWDKLADRYAKKPVSDETSYQRKLQVTREYLRPDMELLEFGCGTGSTAIVHAPFVKHIHAIDISQRMIEIAQGKADASNVANVTFERAAIDEFSAPDRTFDAVLGLSILHLLENKEEVIAKIHRMLKPGGLFVTSTACLGDTMKFFKFVGPIGEFFGLIPLVKVFTKKELADSLTDGGCEIDYQWQPGKGKSVFIVAKKAV